MYHQKTVSDPELGTIILRKQSGISNIRLTVHPRRGIAVTIPWHSTYSEGLDFVETKRNWIVEMMARQKERIRKARSEGRGMPEIHDGITISTQHQEIIVRRSPQGTLFGVEDSWAHPVNEYGRTVSKRRGTMSQKADFVHTESNCSDIRPGIRSSLMEGSNNAASVCVTRITYPYEWGEAPLPGSAEERMITESIISVMRKEAKTYLPERLSKLASAYGFEYNGIQIKNNLTNWGSCSAMKNINLNLHLVRLPQSLCDYVILHELCHLKYMNHGQDYHQFLNIICGEHFKEDIGEGKKYASAEDLQKKMANMLRKYYLW